MELNEEHLRRPRRSTAGNLLQELLQNGLDDEEEAVLQAYDSVYSDSSFSISSDEETIDEVESDFSDEELSGVLEDEDIEVEDDATIRRAERKERAAARKKQLEKAFGKKKVSQREKSKKKMGIEEREGSRSSREEEEFPSSKRVKGKKSQNREATPDEGQSGAQKGSHWRSGRESEEEENDDEGEEDEEEQGRRRRGSAAGSFYSRPARQRPPPTIPLSTRMADALARAQRVKATLEEQQQQADALSTMTALPVGASLAAFISSSSPLSRRAAMGRRSRRRLVESQPDYSALYASSSLFASGSSSSSTMTFPFSSSVRDGEGRDTLYPIHNRCNRVPIQVSSLLSPDYFPRLRFSSMFSAVVDKAWRDAHVVDGHLFSTYSAEWLALRYGYPPPSARQIKWDSSDDTNSRASSTTSRSSSNSSVSSSSSSSGSNAGRLMNVRKKGEGSKVENGEGKDSTRKRQRCSRRKGKGRKKRTTAKEDSEEEEDGCWGRQGWWWEELDEYEESRGGKSLHTSGSGGTDPAHTSGSLSLFTTLHRNPYPAFFQLSNSAAAQPSRRRHGTSPPSDPRSPHLLRRGRGGGTEKRRRGNAKVDGSIPSSPTYRDAPLVDRERMTCVDGISRPVSVPPPLPLPPSPASYASLLYFEGDEGVISQHDYRSNFLYSCAQVPNELSVATAAGEGGSRKTAGSNSQFQYVLGQRITIHKSKSIKDFTQGTSSTIITFSEGLPPCFAVS